MMQKIGWSLGAALLSVAILSCGGGGGAGTSQGSSAVPTVTTAAISSITATSAAGGGSVTSDGGDVVTARGVCWSTAASPTVGGSHTTDGSGIGSFSSAMTGLSNDTTYHVRAYATNAMGTAYGSDVTFTTANPAITHTLTIAISPASSGTVTTSPGSSPFPAGTMVALSAVPAAGFRFKQWSGTDAADVHSNQITMDKNKSLTAEFEATAGAHWQNLSANLSGLAGKASLGCMSWVSATEGWITSNMTVGGAGEIYHTTNGGLTFTPQATQYYTSAIQMLSATEGYAGGLNGRVYRTTNGGGAWVPIGSIGGTLLSISFPPSSSTGYCSGYSGKIYSITSSGVSAMLTGLASNLSSISFPSAQGWACGGSIIVHYNGSWSTDQSYPSESYNAICMLDNTTGWAVGDEGVIIHTTDGLNWNAQTSPDTLHRTLLDVFFLTASEGWAVGDGGVVLHTTNGGATWTIAADGLTSAMLRCVRFTSATNGYVLGNDGTLLKFAD